MSYAEALGLHLPKLPELDPEDVKAVRSSLPGRLLGRTAAFLGLVVLVLGVAGVVDAGLKRVLGIDLSPTPPLRFALLFGLPLLTVASQSVLEWRAEQSRRALQRLAVRVGGEQSGYFRIGPYLDTEQDREKFDRADRMHEKVLAWIERSTAVPLYLTGDSGSGKSSLLNAFVLPALRERGWSVIEARTGPDPESALREALAQPTDDKHSQQGESGDLRALIEAAAERTGARLLLVLDQFEEFVILGEADQQQKFGTSLARLRTAPVRGVVVLLVLRSDYQVFLDDMGFPPLRYSENFYQVARFTIAAAAGFMVRSSLDLQPDAVDRLMTSAAELDETPGLVRPITLNVVGYVLASGSTVASTLDAGLLVRTYIEQTAGQPAIRDFAPPVLEQLVTEQGTKCPRSEEEIVASTDLRRGEVRAVLNALSAAALARPLGPAEGGVWELSHDFVARAVVRYLGRRSRALLQRSVPYAAPALVMAMLMAGIGVTAWNLEKENTQLKQELFKSKIVVRSAAPPDITTAVPGKTDHSAADRLRSFTVPEIMALYHFPSGRDGTGQTIGVVELGGGYRETDLDAYFANLRQHRPRITAVPVEGGRNNPTGDPNGPDGQVMQNVEVAGAVAPGANIAVYFARNTNAGFASAISTATRDAANKPSVILISWGGPESTWAQPEMTALNQALQAAALKGITIVVAAGDNGAADGVGDGRPHVDFPASSPWVLAVGCTTLVATNSTIESETAWDGGPGGGGTGGGVSEVFPLPDWQVNAEVPARHDGGRGRGLPDVTAVGDPRSGYKIFVHGNWTVTGGTGAAASLWAGLVTLLNQGLSGNLGFLNPRLYREIGPAKLLRAITEGNNGTTTLAGYSAGPGWNAVAGWGAPDGQRLLDWLKAHPRSP